MFIFFVPCVSCLPGGGLDEEERQERDRRRKLQKAARARKKKAAKEARQNRQGASGTTTRPVRSNPTAHGTVFQAGDRVLVVRNNNALQRRFPATVKRVSTKRTNVTAMGRSYYMCCYCLKRFDENSSIIYDVIYDDAEGESTTELSRTEKGVPQSLVSPLGTAEPVDAALEGDVVDAIARDPSIGATVQAQPLPAAERV